VNVGDEVRICRSRLAGRFGRVTKVRTNTVTVCIHRESRRPGDPKFVTAVRSCIEPLSAVDMLGRLCRATT
jgi:hypothetical protein